MCILKTKIHNTHDLLLGTSRNKEYSIMINQKSYQQRPKKRNCEQLQKNWTMLTKMSRSFTNVCDKFCSRQPKPCPSVILSLTSNKKE